MKLISARITNFKSIQDTGKFSLADNTCMVGKNESGKTAVLQGLAKSNPANIKSKFDPTYDYPRAHLTRYKKRHGLKPDIVADLGFELSQKELDYLENIYGKGILQSSRLDVSVDYNNKKTWSLDFSEEVWVEYFINSQGFPDVVKRALSKSSNVDELVTNIKEQIASFEEGNVGLEDALAELIRTEDIAFYSIVKNIKLPEFFYFDEYSNLPGEIRLKELISRRDNNELSSSDITALSLLQLADVLPEDFIYHDEFEELQAQLEATSAQLTDDVFDYWSQNNRLSVEFHLATELDSEDQLKDYVLKIRIKNSHHRVTVPFTERSKGFQWFFSFLAAFSQYSSEGNKLILLLDEPGLNLHAKAQEDLLLFMKEKLEPHHQIIYTTHSPFMINPRRLDTVRIVEDKGYHKKGSGTEVSNDFYTGNTDTLFPLQSALGYSLAQTLFVSPRNLLVEGPSDLIYLTLAAEFLGFEELLSNWTIVPVGGADKLATFISLLGYNQLDLAVLLDIAKKDKQKIDNLLQSEHLRKNQLIKLSDLREGRDSDIEDLLDQEGYLQLVNLHYQDVLDNPILENELPEGNPRIVKSIEIAWKKRHVDHNFSHYKPAAYLSKNQELIRSVITDETSKYFRIIFDRLEALMGG